MNGGGLTPLSRPGPSTLSVVPPPYPSASGEGFNFPYLKQVRKDNRIEISAEALPSGEQRSFAIANNKGWFVAATKQGIVASPLQQLQDAFENTESPVEKKTVDGEEVAVHAPFTAKRVVALPAPVTTMAFTSTESRLVLALNNGQIHFFATDQLFSEGPSVNAIHVQSNTQSPARHLVANPSIEDDLVDMVAIVRADGSVELVNASMQIFAGWAPVNEQALVSTAAWSPKGKQIALGLKQGDLLCYSPLQTSVLQKHLPPTYLEGGDLVSVQWLPGAGFNFRTDYAPTDADESEAKQHSLHVDLKASSVVVTELDPHLYRLPERQIQSPFVTVLPRWDQDVPAASALPFLLVLGDMSSTEINMFGRSNADWVPYNGDEVSLPMGHNDTELTMLGLDVDLRNPKGKPILYAYLDDGTLIAWYLESEKKYAGMITPGSTSSAPATSAAVSAPTAVQPNVSAFGAPSPPSEKPAAFGSNFSAFGSASSAPSAQTPTFGSTPTSFGSGGGFGSNPSAFGSGGFGSAKPGGFGSGFGSSNTSAFGQPSGFGAQQPTFGSAQPTFGSAQPAFGNGFGGGGGFGSNTSQPATGFGSSSQAATSSFGTSAFGGGQAVKKDDADAPSTGGGFGGLSLGGSNNSTDADKKPAGGIFGTAAAPTTSTTSPFGASTGGFANSILKPAEGFGASSSLSSDSPFAKAAAPSSGGSAFASAFGGGPAKPPAPSGFGQPSFGQTSKPAFGAAGGSGFGQPMTPPKVGGFGAFAGGTGGFGSAPAPKTGGFAAFAGPAKPADTAPAKPTGFGAFAGKPSVFGSAASEAPKPTGFGAFANGASAFGAPKPAVEQQPAFGSKSDAAKPAVGFGAATTTSSPFGSSAATDSAPKVVNGFGAFASGFNAPNPTESKAQPSDPFKGPIVASSGPSLFGNATNEAKPPSFGTAPDKDKAAAGPEQTKSSDGPVFASAKPTAEPGLLASDAPTTPTPPTPIAKTNDTVSPSPSSAFGAGAFSTPPSSSSTLSARAASVFGLPTTPSTTPQSSPFASAPKTPAASIWNNTAMKDSPFANINIASLSPSQTPQTSPFGRGQPPASPDSGAGSPPASPKTPSKAGSESTTPIGTPAASSVFKPATGFGMFNGSGGGFKDASSPFFKTPEPPKQVSAFALTTPTASPGSVLASSTSTPTFGSPTTLGNRSAFGQPSSPSIFGSPTASTTPTTTPAKPVVGGFGSYSSVASPFGQAAASAPASSFKDMLSGKKTGDPVKPIGAKVKEEPQDGTLPPSPTRSTSAKNDDSDNEPLSHKSAASSFVDVSHESAREPDEAEPDDPADFLSDDDESFEEDSHPSDSDYHREEGEEEEESEEESEDEDEEDAPTPSHVPLPRSRSSTPQAEPLPTIVEETTTPPGSPQKQPPPSSTTPSTGSTLSTKNLPNRPLRSSPLANSVSDSEDDTTELLEVPTPVVPVSTKPKAASPKTPFGIMPIKSEDDQSSGKMRPKTPPLSSSKGEGSIFGKPSQAPVGSLFGPSAQSSKPNAPGSGLFGKPPPAPTSTPSGSPFAPLPTKPDGSQGGLFGKAPATSAGSLFGQTKTTPSPTGTPQPPAKLPTFTLPPSPASPSPFMSPTPTVKPATPPAVPVIPAPPFSIPTPPLPTGSLFGKPPTFTPPPLGQPPRVSPQLPMTLPSSLPTTRPRSQGSMLPPPPPLPSQMRPPTMGPAVAPGPVPPTPASIPPPQPSLEEGMQQQCYQLYMLMQQELTKLNEKRMASRHICEQHGKKLGGSSNKADLGVREKWAPADAPKFGETLLGYCEDLENIQEEHVNAKVAVKDLSSTVLRANTRKEEIERFRRAKEDKSFQSLLKNRALGPESLEAKDRLRKELSRKKREIVRLEDAMADYHRKLIAMKNKKPVFRPPSLDTINRTNRNIDIAVRHEQITVQGLVKRISLLNLDALKQKKLHHHLPSAHTRDKRLPDRKVADVQHFQITSAAALNAERSAQKLKDALFSVRQQPLLNKPKPTKNPAPVSFLSTSQIQRPTSTFGAKLSFGTPIKFQGPNVAEQAPLSEADFTFEDEDHFQVTDYSSLTPSAHGRREKAKKHPAPQVKRVVASGAVKEGSTSPDPVRVAPMAPPASSFDWGPLPAFDHGKTTTSAFFSFTKK